MIYQCYFAEGQQARLFDSPLYRGFGLEPSLNPELTRNCPELLTQQSRTALTEYAAMLHLWRNPRDTDSWIGFTSYRQLDKFPSRFVQDDLGKILQLLHSHDILGWGFYRLRNATTGQPGSVAEISETCHPGITSFLIQLLDRFEIELPAAYFTEDVGLFANYWIASKGTFGRFMEWSYPLVAWCIEHRQTDDFLGRTPKSIGYTAERLFIVWYLLTGRDPANLGVLDLLDFRDTGAATRIDSLLGVPR